MENMENEISYASSSRSSLRDESYTFDLEYLYHQLMKKLKESIRVQDTEMSFQQSFNQNQPEMNRLVEIMKEKKRVVGELVNVISSSEFTDYPENVLHSYLRLIQELTSDNEETLELTKLCSRKLENTMRTVTEEDQKAEVLSKVINEEEQGFGDLRRTINQAFVESREDLLYVLEKLFPNDHEEMRNILHLLVEASNNPDDKYISTKDCNFAHMEFLFSCCLIETDPSDDCRIKLVNSYL